jgi:tetratricopeptide (TPR) repeat protein
MRTPRTVILALGVAVVTGLGLVVVGGIVGRTPDLPAQTEAAPISTVDALSRDIARDQERLVRLPRDWQTWAALGLRYLEMARVTTDPTWYPKAEQAVKQSLTVRPDDNADALVALGALANARHDFGTARGHALDAVALNPYSADAYAVLADAETQLGHTAEATDAVQRILDLRPGLPAFTRASYDLELRGLTHEAADLMRRALNVTLDPRDIAFCRSALGDLALTTGDLATAQAEYDAGQVADPASLTLLRGQSRLAAMAGDLDRALAGYATLTQRAPTPSYLIEYAELLRAAGAPERADEQLALATAAHELFVANGGTDGLTGAALAMATGRIDGAVREAQAEWERRQFVEVADTLAWALHLAGRDAEALPYAQRAVGSGAVSAGYAYHLGTISLALGDVETARTNLNRALTINPAFSPLDAPAARAALSTLES